MDIFDSNEPRQIDLFRGKINCSVDCVQLNLSTRVAGFHHKIFTVEHTSHRGKVRVNALRSTSLPLMKSLTSHPVPFPYTPQYWPTQNSHRASTSTDCWLISRGELHSHTQR